MNLYLILDTGIVATVAMLVIAMLSMRQRRRIRAARRASHEFTGPAEPTPDPEDLNRPRFQLSALHKRLLIALVLMIATALICWKLLPMAHVDIPWYVPLVGFIVITAAALGTARAQSQTDSHDSDSQLP